MSTIATTTFKKVSTGKTVTVDNGSDLYNRFMKDVILEQNGRGGDVVIVSEQTRPA